MKTNFDVLIIGGGTAGIMVASQMRNQNKDISIAVIDPATTHYYQPAWTLVGAGAYDYQKTAKPMKDLIPQGVTWVKEKATELLPDENKVRTETGEFEYKYLVVAPGLVIDPTMIEGLSESLDKTVVCSNYTDPNHTWDVVQNFKGGTALFTQPATPIKCGGAPQKIMYLASDYWNKKGILNQSDVIFATPGTTIFGVAEIRDTLLKVIDRYGIYLNLYHTPVKIDGENQIATFKVAEKGEEIMDVTKHEEVGFNSKGENFYEIQFDMLHLAPPQRAPKFVADSTLSNDAGWMDVDKHTMQSTKYVNVFSLGDCAGLPTAKTGAAIRKQAPIVVANIFELMKDDHLTNQSYNGYSSCPLVTAHGKMVLAEFDYDNNFTPDPKLKQMFISDSSKEHWRLWMLKKYGLPYLYWNKMMKGQDV